VGHNINHSLFVCDRSRLGKPGQTRLEINMTIEYEVKSPRTVGPIETKATVYIADGALAIELVDYPNWFHRGTQRIILGFKWEIK